MHRYTRTKAKLMCLVDNKKSKVKNRFIYLLLLGCHQFAHSLCSFDVEFYNRV